MVACALGYSIDKSNRSIFLDANLRFHAVECRPFGTPYRIMFLSVALQLLTSVWIILSTAFGITSRYLCCAPEPDSSYIKDRH